MEVDWNSNVSVPFKTGRSDSFTAQSVADRGVLLVRGPPPDAHHHPVESRTAPRCLIKLLSFRNIEKPLFMLFFAPFFNEKTSSSNNTASVAASKLLLFKFAIKFKPPPPSLQRTLTGPVIFWPASNQHGGRICKISDFKSLQSSCWWPESAWINQAPPHTWTL